MTLVIDRRSNARKFFNEIGTRRSFVSWLLQSQVRTLIQHARWALRRLVDGPPLRLDFNLLCNGKGIVDINAEIPNSALDFGVAE